MDALTTALDMQRKQLEELKDILESELHLISSREPETLMNVLQDKQELLAKIDEQDKVISPLYQTALDNDEITPEITQGIDACKAVVEECKYLTRINAKSVEQGQLKLTHLRNLMVELRARESMTYDRTGKPKGASSGKGYSA